MDETLASGGTLAGNEDDFFEGKRPWSVIKDQVLKDYMSPYLAKIKNLKKPILLVDGYAGPGVFDDRQPGSPLIMCQAAAKATPGTYRAFFINKPPETGECSSEGWVERCSYANSRGYYKNPPSDCE